MNKLDIAQAKVDKAGKIGDIIKIQHDGLLGGAVFKILSGVYLDEEGSTKIKLELIDGLGDSEVRKHIKNGFSYQYNLEDSDAIITPHAEKALTEFKNSAEFKRVVKAAQSTLEEN